MKNLFKILFLSLLVFSCGEKMKEKPDSSERDEPSFLHPYGHLSSIKKIEYYDNGNKKVEGYLLDGRKRLRWVYYNEDGSISHDEFYENRGFSRGEIIYDDDGNRVICNYKEGLLHGEWFSYDKYGFLSLSGMYENGLKEGPWISYTLHGDLEFLLFEGKDLHVHDTGETIFKNGKKNGKMIKTEVNSGWTLEEGYYKNGKKDGEWTSYYLYDKIESQGEYKDGKKDEKWIYNNKDGTLQKEETYKDGKLIETKEY